MDMRDTIEVNFSYHAPKGDQPRKYEEIRAMGKQFARLIEKNCPSSDESYKAMEKLEEAVMWANASIARHE